MKIGLIKEGKIPRDNRVALAPDQCKWIKQQFPHVNILAEASPDRCFSDSEYRHAGIEVTDDISDCEILLGIKEVPVEALIPNKTYLFFSHTRKKQAYNQTLFKAIIEKKITLIDYESLEHEDGQRILGFGFFAGVVGAHNGIMAFGKRSGIFDLQRVYKQKSFRELIHTYFGLKIPPIKIVVTGSGRVAHGVLEIMNLLEIIEVEPAELLEKTFSYPVYTQLKGAELYAHRETGNYNRDHFHTFPEQYTCKFRPYLSVADILMNGIFWDIKMPRLFEWEDLTAPDFKTLTIADITDDKNGSVPCNLGDSSIEDPVYGVNRLHREKTAPYLPGSVDIMAVGNLPNELPRDASRYFGEQLIKHIMEDLIGNRSSEIIRRATMVNKGILTKPFDYLRDYAGLPSEV